MNKFTKILMGVICLVVMAGTIQAMGKGGDGPFPLRIATGKTWVSEGFEQRLVVRLKSGTVAQNGDRTVQVAVGDTFTHAFIYTGNGVLPKDAPELRVQLVNANHEVAIATLQIRFNERLGDYELVMKLQLPQYPGEKTVVRLVRRK